MYLTAIWEEMCWNDEICVTFSVPMALKDSNGCLVACQAVDELVDNLHDGKIWSETVQIEVRL